MRSFLARSLVHQSVIHASISRALSLSLASKSPRPFSQPDEGLTHPVTMEAPFVLLLLHRGRCGRNLRRTWKARFCHTCLHPVANRFSHRSPIAVVCSLHVGYHHYRTEDHAREFVIASESKAVVTYVVFFQLCHSWFFELFSVACSRDDAS